MSGGSFKYLYSRDVSELLGSQGELEHMAEWLSAHDAQDAAAEVEDIIASIRQFQRRADTRLRRMSDLFKAVEWYESNDWGKERVDKELARYRGMSCEPESGKEAKS